MECGLNCIRDRPCFYMQSGDTRWATRTETRRDRWRCVLTTTAHTVTSSNNIVDESCEQPNIQSTAVTTGASNTYTFWGQSGGPWVSEGRPVTGEILSDIYILKYGSFWHKTHSLMSNFSSQISSYSPKISFFLGGGDVGWCPPPPLEPPPLHWTDAKSPLYGTNPPIRRSNRFSIELHESFALSQQNCHVIRGTG